MKRISGTTRMCILFYIWLQLITCFSLDRITALMTAEPARTDTILEMYTHAVLYKGPYAAVILLICQKD